MNNNKRFTKICSKCGSSKTLDKFNNDKSRKDGKQRTCIICVNQYYIDNKEKIKEKSKQYYNDNNEKIKEKKKQYKINNKDSVDKENIKYRNSEKGIKKKKEYRTSINGIKKAKESRKKYYINNKDKEKEHNKRFKENNKDYFIIKVNERKRNMNTIPLNKSFKNCHKHHINKDYIIHIPKEIHINNYGHNHKKPETMILINKIAWEYLYLRPNDINKINLKKYKNKLNEGKIKE